MKTVKRWIAFALALVIVLGTSMTFVDYRLKASDTDTDTTAREQQEAAADKDQVIEIVIPALDESETEDGEESAAEETAVEEPIEEETAEEQAIEEVAEEKTAEDETVEEEQVEEEQEAEIVSEVIYVSDMSFKASSHVYAAGENATVELRILPGNAEGAILDKFVLEIIKVNSVESIERTSMSGFTVKNGKLAENGIEYLCKLGFVPFDGENTSASLKAIIKNTDKEETELASCMITFERSAEDATEEEPIEEEPTEEEPTEEAPTIEEPAEEEPAEEEPTEEETTEEEPIEEEPTEGETTEEEPIEEEPTEGETTEEETTEEEPIEEEPTEEEPTEEEPAAEESTGEELTEEEITEDLQDSPVNVVLIECEEVDDRLSLYANTDALTDTDIIPVFRWEYAPIGSEDWQVIEGAEEAELTFENSFDVLTMQYRCAILYGEERLESQTAVFLNEQEQGWINEGQVTTLRELASARYWNSVDILVMEMGCVRHLQSNTIVAYVNDAGYLIDADSENVIGMYDVSTGRIFPIEL